MQSLLRYGRAFGETYCVRFVDVRMMDILGDTMSSNILAGIARRTSIRYITVGKMIIKQTGV